jgi:O-antigen/teichoic acid export membrane protein
MLRVMLSIGGLQLLTMIVLLARTKVLALLLGPEQYGVMAVIDKLLAVVAQTVSFSMPFAALRFLPALWATDRARFGSELRAMGATILVLALAATLVGVVSTTIVGVHWGAELASYDAIIALGFLTIPALALVPFLQNALAARLAHRDSQRFQLANAALFSVAGIAGAATAGLQGIYALYATLGTALVAWRARLLRAEIDAPAAPESFRDLLPSRRIWRFSSIMFALAFLTPYAALFTHYQVLQHVGAAGAGWLQAAWGIAIAVRSLLGTGHAIFLTPHVNRSGSPEERMQWAIAFQRTFCLLAILLVPPLLLAADVAVRLLYSRAFAPATPYVFLFVIVEIVGLLAGTYQTIVVALDRLGFHVLQNLAAQFVIIALSATFVPSAGIGGVVVAALAAQLLLYTATSMFLWARFGLRQDARTLALTVYVVAALLAAGVVGRSSPALVLPSLLLRLAVYALLLLLVPLFTTDDERGRVRTIARRAAGRLGLGVIAP